MIIQSGSSYPTCLILRFIISEGEELFMESPLTELSKQSVSTALEVNLVEHTRFYCKSSMANFNEVGEAEVKSD